MYIYIYTLHIDMISSFAMCRTEASTYWTVFSVLQQSILGDREMCLGLLETGEALGKMRGYPRVNQHRCEKPMGFPRNFHIYVSWTNHWIGLRENLSRKPWFVPWNMGVSYEFSLKPIRWIKKKDKTWRKLGEKCGLNSSNMKIAPVFFTVSRMG